MNRNAQPIRLRVLVGISCLAVIVFVLVFSFRERFAGLPAVEKQRALMRSLRAPFSPATYLAQSQSLDTDAVPVLTKALETKPTTLDKVYSLAWSNAPGAVRSNLPSPLDSAAAAQMRESASVLLAEPKIARSVPPSTFTNELQDPSWVIRANALAGLYNAVLPESGPDGLGEEKGRIFGLLLTAAQDPEKMVRGSALGCLAYFKDASDQVILVLSKALSDYSAEVRIRAAMAFYRLDPALAEKAGALTAAIDFLQSSGLHVSEQTAADFLKNQGKRPLTTKQ